MSSKSHSGCGLKQRVIIKLGYVPIPDSHITRTRTLRHKKNKNIKYFSENRQLIDELLKKGRMPKYKIYHSIVFQIKDSIKKNNLESAYNISSAYKEDFSAYLGKHVRANHIVANYIRDALKLCWDDKSAKPLLNLLENSVYWDQSSNLPDYLKA